MKLLISEYVKEYMKEDIHELLDYGEDYLIEKISECVAPHEGFVRLSKAIDQELEGLIGSRDEHTCYIDTPHGDQVPLYYDFDSLKYE